MKLISNLLSYPSDRKYLQEEFCKVLDNFSETEKLVYCLIISGNISSLSFCENWKDLVGK